MVTKQILSLTNKNLGATGGTAYGSIYDILDAVSKGEGLAFWLKWSNDQGTTPTLDVSLEFSFDGTNFYDSGFAFAQKTTSSGTEWKAWTLGTHKHGPFLRVKYVIGGTVTPQYDFDVWLVGF